jgi:hypothetical protein
MVIPVVTGAGASAGRRGLPVSIICFQNLERGSAWDGHDSEQIAVHSIASGEALLLDDFTIRRAIRRSAAALLAVGIP